MTGFSLDEFNLAKSRMFGDINKALTDAEGSRKAGTVTVGTTTAPPRPSLSAVPVVETLVEPAPHPVMAVSN